MKTNNVLLTATLASAAAAFGAAPAVAHHAPEPPKTSHPTRQHPGRAGRQPAGHRRDETASAALASQYSVFARAQQPGDHAPQSVATLAALANDNPNHHPANVDSTGSRRVGNGPPIYLLPATGGLCAALVIPHGHTTAMACVNAAHQQFSSAITLTPSGWTVWGAAADAIRSVTATLPSGQATIIAVHNNGFSETFPSRPTGVKPAATPA
jgi:hypothetical protein